MPLTPQSTIGQLVVEKPSRSRLFEALGIDYCCGGKKPLADVCRDKGLNVDDVLDRLLRDEQQAAEPRQDDDPGTLTLTQLSDHIEQTHHEWLRTELPRLAALLEKVARAHGQRDPRLVELHNTFEDFAYHLFSHMHKEERILFPALRQLERGELGAKEQGMLGGPIDAMTLEHDEAGAALSTMRRLTDDFTIPDNACNTHRAVLDALATLEADMHQHVHKENNILFPAARQAAGLGAT